MTNQQLSKLLSKLSLDEKISMVHGSALFQTAALPNHQIPAFTFSDGPMGPRQEYEKTEWFPISGNDDYTSYLPCNSAIAATFNRRCSLMSGQVLGREARGRGKDMILAPGINIHRSPLGGRDFEYMSEDPYLTAEIAVPYIQGIQENDVAACVKHFALNNQETRRTSYQADVSERALWEIYLPAFRAAVKEGHTRGMMGAYNLYKEEFLCHSQELVNGVLRGEWGFDGIYVSDWGAVHDTVKAGRCEIDVDMNVTNEFDKYPLAAPLKEAILSGSVSEEDLDKKVMHILHVMNELHMLDGVRSRGAYNLPSSRAALLETAQESIILLKNDKKLLPLNPDSLKKILVIGDNADRTHAAGGGSAEIKALYELTPLMGIKMLLGGNCEVVYEPGYYTYVIGTAWDIDTAQNSAAASSNLLFAPRQSRKVPAEEIPALNALYEKRALDACADADAVLFIGGLNHDHDVEGRDRSEYHLPYEQDALIKKLLAVRPDLIITLFGGSPVSMESWIDDAHTLLYSYYNGMEGGLALARILFGEESPSGKLPTTFPKRLSDSPAHSLGEFPGDTHVSYGEDIFVGYRYFDTYGVTPEFAFGYGLSYASFTYSNLQVSDLQTTAVDADTAAEKLPALFHVELAVANESDMDAKESVQVYIHACSNPCTADGSERRRPYKELRAFDKKQIPAKGKVLFAFDLSAAAFTYYEEETKCYIAPKGAYEILVGASSDRILLRETITLVRDYKISRF